MVSFVVGAVMSLILGMIMRGFFLYSSQMSTVRDLLSEIGFGVRVRVYNALSISSQRRGSNPLGFSYLKNMLKDHLFKTSRLQFDNCGFWGPKSSRDFRETDPCPLKRCYDENNRFFFSDFFY